MYCSSNNSCSPFAVLLCGFVRSSSLLLLLLLSSRVTLTSGRHAQAMCDDGRGEGDKWFDGCRWCVCQRDGPLCSPASCSELVTQVPPCEEVGSSWRDGCYHCKCHLGGIDCVTDAACVVLMQTDIFLSCVEPEDDRCVCGVDGTPSCTAEVIDRHAHPATTIALDTSYNDANSEEGPSQRFGYEDYPDSEEFEFESEEDESEWGKRRVKRRTTLEGYLRRREQRRTAYRQYQEDLKSGLRSSYHKPYRFFNRLGGYYNYAGASKGYPSGGYHTSNHARDRKRFRSPQKYPSPFWREVERRREEEELSESDREMPMADQGRQFTAPRSLLIITNNRCRYGARWYGGGLRCYCDGDGSITCGDPKFVSTRIDGFRLEKDQCEEGHAWYDDGNCQVCECKFSGVVLCRRSESCPLPFLIQPVRDLSPSEEPGMDSNQSPRDYGDVVSSSDERKAVDRRSEFRSHSRFPVGNEYDRYDDNSDKPSFGHSLPDDNEKTIELSLGQTGKPPVVIDRETDPFQHHPHHNHNSNNNHNSRHPHNHHRYPPYHKPNPKKHTTVIVTECNPGSRWLDGCKRCSCNPFGQKHCNDRLCLKPAVPAFKPPRPLGIAEPGSENGRPFQLPPAISIIRNKPVKIKSPFPIENPCGKFKVGDRYWIRCNRCLCTPHGPKCTAINCG